MMEQITIDGVLYSAHKIHPSETSEKHCIFYGNDWYELIEVKDVIPMPPERERPNITKVGFLTAKAAMQVLIANGVAIKIEKDGRYMWEATINGHTKKVFAQIDIDKAIEKTSTKWGQYKEDMRETLRMARIIKMIYSDLEIEGKLPNIPNEAITWIAVNKKADL